MTGGSLVREGRLRAALTQRELGEAVGLSQPTVARIESGVIEPSFAQIQRLLYACGLDLRVSLVPADESDWSLAQTNLRLDRDARVRQHQSALRFAHAGREALERARA